MSLTRAKGCSQSAVVSFYQKWSKEQQWWNGDRVIGSQGLSMHVGSEGWPMWFRANRWATVAQIAEVNAGSDKKVSEYTVHRRLLCMGLHSHRPARVPMLTPVHYWKRQQWACEHQNWTTEQWKKLARSDDSRFLLHHVDGRVLVCCLPGEHMAQDALWEEGMLVGGSVMLWAMFCWDWFCPIPWWLWPLSAG